MERFGSAEAALAADERDLGLVRGIGPTTARRISALRNGWALREELRRANMLGIRIITWRDPDYPAPLLNITHPPPVLYLQGDILPSDALSVAIVGSRRPTRYGIAAARHLAGQAADVGLVVVSGMARGIDSEAHRGALARGGRTVAVLGSGLDIVYPPENEKLAARIAGNGALVSERSLGTRPYAQNFPARNRIISGLALGVVVVEAGETSGALITADFGLEQGREVFAVPGDILSPLSRGTHRLIKQGARLVEGIEDILEELGIQPRCGTRSQHGTDAVALSAREKRILEMLGFSPSPVDDIVIGTGLPASEVAATLVSLELKGVAARGSGGYSRCLKEGG